MNVSNTVKTSLVSGLEQNNQVRSSSNIRELWELFQQKQYQNLPVRLNTYFRRESKLSDGAILCWQLLQELSFYNKDWSVQISLKELGDELGKGERQTARLLNALEDGGYILREGKEGFSTRIYVRLPSHVIEILENAPNRSRAIEKCGTIDEDNNVTEEIDTHDKNVIGAKNGVCQNCHRGYDRNVIGGYDKNDSYINNNINNKYKYNNKNTCVVDNFSSGDDIIVSKPLANSLPNSHQAKSCVSVDKSNSTHEIDLFAGEMVESDSADKVAKRQEIEGMIAVWKQDLDSMPAIEDVAGSERLDALRRHGQLSGWIEQQERLLHDLDKPVVREDLSLGSGDRKLSDSDCRRINDVLVKAYRSGQISLDEAHQTKRSMVHEILCGYYYRKNVDIGRSINSVLSKFKSGEWVNNPVQKNKDKASRPIPPMWEYRDRQNKRINFDGVIKNVN